jgi:hypothetical protein
MSPTAIVGWIAHVAFWALLIVGAWSEDLRPRGIAFFLLLWLAGLFGLPYMPYGAGLFTSYVAILDIVLVFIVLKSDVWLT